MAETTFRPVNLATEVPGSQGDPVEVTRGIKASQVTKITSTANTPGIGPTATLGGRGTHRGRFNHATMWENHHSGGHSSGQAPSASPVLGTPAVPEPTGAPVSFINPIIGPNSTSGGSLLARYMSKETFTKALHDRQRIRRTERSSVKCALASCTNQLTTGPGVKFCFVCGSNQETLKM